MPITALVTRGYTFATGTEVSSASLNQLGEPTVTIPSISATEVVMENYTVATLPSNGTTGRIVYVSNGDGGSPCLAVDDGTDWVRINLGSAVSTTDADEYLMAE
jgi:hypothetical protein